MQRLQNLEQALYAAGGYEELYEEEACEDVECGAQWDGKCGLCISCLGNDQVCLRCQDDFVFVEHGWDRTKWYCDRFFIILADGEEDLYQSFAECPEEFDVANCGCNSYPNRACRGSSVNDDG